MRVLQRRGRSREYVLTTPRLSGLISFRIILSYAQNKHWWLDTSAREKLSFALISNLDFCPNFLLALISNHDQEIFYLATISGHTIFKISRFPLALISNHVFEKNKLPQKISNPQTKKIKLEKNFGLRKIFGGSLIFFVRGNLL